MTHNGQRVCEVCSLNATKHSKEYTGASANTFCKHADVRSLRGF
jgi:hypothetical protein